MTDSFTVLALSAPVVWSTVISAVIFVGSLVALPIVIIRMPKDYFAEDDDGGKTSSPRDRVVAIVRNVLGAILMIAGIAMLFLPGQGVLMILVALVVMQFPGKKRLERKILARRSVLRALNRIRKLAHKPPLDCRRRRTAAA